MSHATYYKKGTLIYDNTKSWSGYTLFQVKGIGLHLINMRGEVVKLWRGFYGSPNKIFKNAKVFGSLGERSSKYSVQDMEDLTLINWNGEIEWTFKEFEKVEIEQSYMARQHHDYQIDGNPTGYYSPYYDKDLDLKKTNKIILGHRDVKNKNISSTKLLDDVIYEINDKNEIIWSWEASNCFEELEFSDAAKKAIYNNPNKRIIEPEIVGDWLHINSMAIVGENIQYSNFNDERFNPKNIIFSSREANIIAIIDKKTKKIVWKLGPTFEKIKNIGPIIGPHHVHIIPKGLPGEGNLLLFDNGGWAGYGNITENSDDGTKVLRRDYSRILEINPRTMEVVWKYTPKEAGFKLEINGANFYSPLSSSVQRLVNGNTLITEGVTGRIFEVTVDGEIVWEYISPYMRKGTNINMLYRAYRIPYEWIAQLEVPVEESIIPETTQEYYTEKTIFTEVKGVKRLENFDINTCVAVQDEEIKKERLFSINEEIFKEINTLKYRELLKMKKKKLNLIFIGAERCKNCKQLHSNLEAEASYYEENYDFYHLDADRNRELLEEYKIKSIPTLLVIKNGKICEKSIGNITLDVLQDLLDKNI